MSDDKPPPRPRRYLACVKCGVEGHPAPESPIERWTCPRCLSDDDRTDRDWRGEGAGQ